MIATLSNRPTATATNTSTPTVTRTFTITPVITKTATLTSRPTNTNIPTASATTTATPTKAATARATATKIIATHTLYLPIILKPPFALNGDFETGNFTGWSLDHGQGEYLSQVVTSDGDFAARIGNPQADCNGASPMNDKVAFYQTISVPYSQSTALSFNYRLLSQDDRRFERLNLYILPANNPNGAPIWTEGAPPSATQCDEPAYDSGWQPTTLPLSKYQGQSVTIRFELESQDDTRFFNTWVYIDDIEVTP
jgi:hypothetical protein